MNKNFTLGILSVCMFGHLFSQTITIDIEKDAAIGYHDGYSTENNNYGTATQCAAYTIPGASGGLNKNRALLEFDLSQIPNNAQIVSAKLYLFAIGQIGTLNGHSGANEAYISRVTQAWDEDIVTWSNQPSSTTNNQVTLQQSTSSTQDYIVNITNIVEDMINSDNYGVLLKLANESTTRTMLFCSSDYSDLLKRPYVVIQYKVTETNITEKNTEKQDILVSPNPFTNEIHISVNIENPENLILSIYDVHGKLVSAENLMNASKGINNFEYHTTSLKEGVYFMEIRDGFRVKRTKIVK